MGNKKIKANYKIHINTEGKTENEITYRKAFTQNLLHYMNLNNVDRKKISNDLDFNYSTVRDWTNERAYPRPEKIEKLAKYFNITTADLVENKKIIYEFESPTLTDQIEKLSDNDVERELLITCTLLNPSQQKNVLNMIKSLIENDF